MAPLYWRTGSVYVMRRDVILMKRAIYGDAVHGYLVNEPRSWFNIDSEFDWQLTEAWLRYEKRASR
jgi:CMP-N-acetylneuraminic acid synthetase